MAIVIDAQNEDAVSGLTLTAFVHLRCGTSEGRIVGFDVSIRFDEVVTGTIVVVAADLRAVAGLEGVEDSVKEVEDFDGGFVGQRWQPGFGSRVVFAHGMSFGFAQRAAALRRAAAADSGGANTSR